MSGVRRLSKVQRALVCHLARHAPLHGFGLAAALDLWTATVYPALQRLEESGLVRGELEQGDPAALGRPLRRLYRLTEDGKRLAQVLAVDERDGRVWKGELGWA